MPLSEDDVREILRLIDDSALEELRVETEGFSLHVRRGDMAGAELVHESEPGREGAVEAADGLVAITSPMLGTFYRAEAPGAMPYVDVGARVEPETTVCLIEVMKMMNPIPAGVSGTIAEICAENAEPVEYGAPLFRVQPDL